MPICYKCYGGDKALKRVGTLRGEGQHVGEDVGRAPQEDEILQKTGKDILDKKRQHVQKHTGLKGCGVLSTWQ